MTGSVDVRTLLVELLRRDLFGLHPDVDPDLAREVLDEKPSRWYLGGFLVPAADAGAPIAKDDDDVGEEAEDAILATETLDSPVGPEADEQDAPDQPPKDRFLPSSIGLTVMLHETVREIDLRATWGDYRTEPPLPDVLLLPEASEPGTKKPDRPEKLHWVRTPGEARLMLDVTRNRSGIVIPGSAAPQRPGGGLEVALHQRLIQQTTPEGTTERLRVVTVFLISRRKRARAPYTDAAYAFQARIELHCDGGFRPRHDFSTYHSDDADLRLGDLHYRDVCEYAVGRNTSGGWEERIDETGNRLPVTRVWTDPMPCQEVEKVVPNTGIDEVEFGMDALDRLASTGAEAIGAKLDGLPTQYAAWRAEQERLLAELAPRRRATAGTLLANMDRARERIAAGIALIRSDPRAREAFAIMNRAMATAARRRDAIIQGRHPDALDPPKWRPFQLAFILLNLAGLTDKTSREREIVDLLFFPTKPISGSPPTPFSSAG